MASESTQPPMNGTYHAHHHPNHYATDPYNAHVAANNTSATSAQAVNDSKNEIPKDEVGWYFVEQYYTTLSRSPEKLHLFYSRHSKFVSGFEAQKVTVAVGQKAINERIAELDFQDCKVRVLNVDSQASFENILVSVIGEISNKSEPPRKFVQTFVLAEQPNGYYVLNDIFRYLADEDEELVEEAPAAEAAAAEPEASVEATKQPETAQPAAPEPEPQAAEKPAVEQTEVKPEVNGDAEATKEEPTPQTNGTATQEQTTAPTAAVPTPAVPAPAEAKPEETKQPEQPAAAPPTKATPPAPAKETPAPAPAKAAPMTWASIAGNKTAGAAVATPAAVTPAVPTTTAPQTKPQTPAQTATPPSGETAAGQASSNDNAGWQTAGADNSKKQSRPQSVSATGGEQVSAFVKNVNEKVDASLLRQALARYGKLNYFDVNRQKNCAFVEFADTKSYNNAVAANPHQIGSEQVTVEERRPRSTAYGGPGFGPGRGGHRGRGDGRSSSQGRGGFQKDAGRGGYGSRGRGGGNVTPKGRSQPQAA